MPGSMQRRAGLRSAVQLFKLKFFPQKSDFPSQTAAIEVPRSAYILIWPISSSARFCFGVGVVVI